MKQIFSLLVVIIISFLIFNGCETSQGAENESLHYSKNLQVIPEGGDEKKTPQYDDEEQKTEINYKPNEIEIVEEYYDGAIKITRRHDEKNFIFYGVVNTDGDTIIECNYKTYGILSDDRILVHTFHFNWDSQFARIYDAHGNIISDGEWKYIYFFRNSEGVLSPTGYGEHYVPEGGGYYLINHDGKKISSRFDGISLGSDWLVGELLVFVNGEAFIVDPEGNRIDNPQLDWKLQ